MTTFIPSINYKFLLGLFFGAVVFVAVAQWSGENRELLQTLTHSAGILGIISYMGILAASIVFAPLGTGFLIPIAATSFGPFWAAVYSIIGWTLGSVIAFVLARTLKRATLSDSELFERLHAYEERVPVHYRYGLIILLRMALPVDLLSYALAFGSTITFWPFVSTTLIGITPLTFIFTYASQSTLWVQGAVALLSSLIFVIGLWYVRKKFFILNGN